VKTCGTLVKPTAGQPKLANITKTNPITKDGIKVTSSSQKTNTVPVQLNFHTTTQH
jgi:hypothetical protein